MHLRNTTSRFPVSTLLIYRVALLLSLVSLLALSVGYSFQIAENKRQNQQLQVMEREGTVIWRMEWISCPCQSQGNKGSQD